MSKLIEQTLIFKASPHEVYEALMDASKHAAFTNSEAEISREIGGEFCAYAGYISGSNLELVPDRKIVQTWHAMGWPEDHYSKVTFLLEPVPEGTRLSFIHANLPEGSEAEFEQGWVENYWEPMKAFLEK